jgi:hypothetical protein
LFAIRPRERQNKCFPHLQGCKCKNNVTGQDQGTRGKREREREREREKERERERERERELREMAFGAKCARTTTIIHQQSWFRHPNKNISITFEHFLAAPGVDFKARGVGQAFS